MNKLLETTAVVKLGLVALSLLLAMLFVACNQEGEVSNPTAKSTADSVDQDHSSETAAEHAGHEHSGETTDEHAAASGAHKDGGADEHDHAELIQLTPEQLKAYGVKVAVAEGGQLKLQLSLPGEVAVNADRVGHVLPKLGGVVQQVTKNIGDGVRAGDLLVVLDSAELASAKAEYLAARERVAVAQANAERERQLVDKGLSPKQDLINAENVVRELEIQLLAAEQALHALGISEEEREQLASAPHAALTRYEIRAPISGHILEKHVSIGEMVGSDDELFLIADLSTVWIDLNASQGELPSIREGQEVLVRFDPSAASDTEERQPAQPGIPDAQGKVKYIDALIAEDTRKATVRLVLANPQGRWKPGMFVTGYLSTTQVAADVLVPLASVIKFEGQNTVFIQDDHGFVPRPVQLGRQSATQVEILDGLSVGDRYVTEGAYLVKAEVGKSEAGHGH